MAERPMWCADTKKPSSLTCGNAIALLFFLCTNTNPLLFNITDKNEIVPVALFYYFGYPLSTWESNNGMFMRGGWEDLSALMFSRFGNSMYPMVNKKSAMWLIRKTSCFARRDANAGRSAAYFKMTDSLGLKNTIEPFFKTTKTVERFFCNPDTLYPSLLKNATNHLHNYFNSM